jgi:hypothetical protein
MDSAAIRIIHKDRAEKCKKESSLKRTIYRPYLQEH